MYNWRKSSYNSCFLTIPLSVAATVSVQLLQDRLTIVVSNKSLNVAAALYATQVWQVNHSCTLTKKRSISLYSPDTNTVQRSARISMRKASYNTCTQIFFAFWRGSNNHSYSKTKLP